MEIWALVAGAWGDSLACYGNICKYVKEHGLDQVNVVYHGLHPEIPTFLKQQKYIGRVSVLSLGEVRTEKGLDPAGYFNFFQSAELLATNFTGWMRATQLDQQLPGLLPTHVSREWPLEPYRDFEIYLPGEPARIEGPFLLFQPYSVQSCPYHMHWEYWMEALAWVLENLDLKVVLVGTPTSDFDTTFAFPTVEHPKLLNLVGKTKSLLDVLHIMGQAECLITTSNSLSMWSILTQKPSLVVCHKAIRQSYFYHWINCEPNHVLAAETSLEQFQQECGNWFRKVQLPATL